MSGFTQKSKTKINKAFKKKAISLLNDRPKFAFYTLIFFQFKAENEQKSMDANRKRFKQYTSVAYFLYVSN